MKIKIKNFQSIKSAEIEVEGLTVITGPNNIGKSALARAVGGLFSNLRGNSFVRRGEKYCSVEIVFDDTESVSWEKGKSKNNYVVNGATISKVGNNAPEELEAFKVIPVSVDGKQIWPQIAKQFEQIFLLNLPPSAISSALSDVEKIKKLESASALCRKDVRDIKSRLSVKREDLDKTQSLLDCFKDFDFSIYDQIKQSKKEIEETELLLEKLSSLLEEKEKTTELIATLRKADVTIEEADFSEFSTLPSLISLSVSRKKSYNTKSSIQYSLRGLEIKPTSQVEEIDKTLNVANKLLSKRNKIEKLKALSEEIKEVDLPEIEIPEDFSPMRAKKEKLELGINLAKNEVAKVDSQLEELHSHISEGVCPLCLRGEDK